MENPVIIYVISDAIGETAQHIIRAVTAQFSLNKPADIRRHAFIRDESALLETLEEAKAADGIVVQTLVQAKLAEYATNFCVQNNIPNVDLLHTLTAAVEAKTGLKSKQDPGNMRRLDSNYFDRIAAIEFAVKYDDCKDPRGLLDADIVLVGVSRTSKTPLSSFLANQNWKVANVPLVPKFRFQPNFSNPSGTYYRPYNHPRKTSANSQSPFKIHWFRRSKQLFQ